MWQMNKGPALILIIVFLVIGIGMIYFSSQVPPTALTDDGYPLKNL